MFLCPECFNTFGFFCLKKCNFTAKNKYMRIIFMGTPDFAVEALKKLVEHKQNVVAVITAPDKPAGRGQKLQQPAVKKYALAQQIPVLQPEKLKNSDFLAQLRSYHADLQIVVAFRMLPEVVWSMPPLGTFNLHASLLPQYRGAAPINWAIIHGEKQTGVTTFFIQHEIDTGNVLFQEKVDIEPNETAGTLHDKLMEVGARLVVKTVDALKTGNYLAQKQSEFDVLELKAAPKIFKADCRIDWTKTAAEIDHFIRGMSPYPTAWTTLKNKQSGTELPLKIFFTKVDKSKNTQTAHHAGQLLVDNGKLFCYATDYALEITDLQLSGKKRMDAKAFINGFKPEEYIIGHQ